MISTINETNIKEANENKTASYTLKAIKQYYQRNKDQLNQKRYQQYLEKKDDPEYKEKKKLWNKNYLEKQKLIKQQKMTSTESNIN